MDGIADRIARFPAEIQFLQGKLLDFSGLLLW
jgi:hypothetical protein